MSQRRPAVRSFRLRGRAMQAARFATAVFLAGDVLFVAVDLLNHRPEAPALQGWVLIPQAVFALGLFVLGRRLHAPGLVMIAVLGAFILIEEAFHILNPLMAWLDSLVRLSDLWSSRATIIVDGVLFYGLVAIVGGALLGVAFFSSPRPVRKIVRNVTLLLIAGGVFGGPVSVAGTIFARYREWGYAEELGEAAVFAVVAGYVVGLLILTRAGREVWSQASPGDDVESGDRPPSTSWSDPSEAIIS